MVEVEGQTLAGLPFSFWKGLPMPQTPSDAVRTTKAAKPHIPKLGSFRQNSPIAAPYLRPEENPRALAAMAHIFRREFQPANAEDEALVNVMTYLQWRIQRFKRDQILIEEHGGDNPDQAIALECSAQAITSLEQMGAWAITTLLYLRRLQIIDTAEAMEDKALNPHGTHIPAPLPPETKPN
jgi:hypothetical protein